MGNYSKRIRIGLPSIAIIAFSICASIASHALDKQSTAAVASDISFADWCDRGNKQMIQGNYVLAIGDFTKSLELDPMFIESLYNRGFCYMRLKQFDKAAGDFRAITTRAPEAGGERELGEALYRLGRYDESIKYFTESSMVNPDPSVFNRGVIYLKLGNWNAAIEDFSSILKRHPQCAPCLLNRSIAYSALSKKQEASMDRKQAYTIEPKLRRSVFHDIYPIRQPGVGTLQIE
jgi:tetratricopeptide (TPR) repeat protein